MPDESMFMSLRVHSEGHKYCISTVLGARFYKKVIPVIPIIPAKYVKLNLSELSMFSL